MIKRSDEQEGQNERNIINRNDEKECEKQEDVLKKSDEKEDLEEKDTTDNSAKKESQKDGDVLERSVEQQHDFDSMKGNANKLPDPKDSRLSKRSKVRLNDILRNCVAQVNCSLVIIIHDFLALRFTTREDLSCLVYQDTNCKPLAF